MIDDIKTYSQLGKILEQLNYNDLRAVIELCESLKVRIKITDAFAQKGDLVTSSCNKDRKGL